MKLEILIYPDRRLKQKSENVEIFDKKLHEILDSMYEIMMVSNGIGLAAIQVNMAINALIINLPDEDGNQEPNDLLEIINPKIIKKSGHTTYQEGCLSVPGFYEDVDRYEEVVITYQNRDADKKELKAAGLLGIAIQHEMDHLVGKLFIEKLSYTKRKKFEKEYKRAIKEKKYNL